MASIREAVEEIYKKDKKITVSDLRDELPWANSKTLSSALSLARKLFPDTDEDTREFKKIDEEIAEKVILKLLNKRADTANARLMLDFLKIKRMSGDLDTDLDITIFLKKINSKISVESDNSK